MQLRARLTRVQIDRARMIRAYDRGERRALSRGAARIRLYSRRRMRRRKRAARPGEGPTVRQGQLKRFLLYAYEPQTGTAVIGVKKLPGARSDTPAILEHGGVISREVGRGRDRRRARVRYEKRPATGPGLDQGRGELPGFWRDVVK